MERLVSSAGKLGLLLILLVAAVGVACGGREAPSITVLAASSLTDAFTEMAAVYEEGHPGTTVQLSFASSSTLAAQIVNGAPADVFASANEIQMGNVLEAGAAEESHSFATNSLVIITPADNPAGIDDLADLARPGVTLITALPDVPIRVFTDEMVARAAATGRYGDNFQERVLSNVISEEGNVRQLTTKIALGEADAGIVYRTDARGDIADDVVVISIPDDVNVVATYPIAVLTGAPAPEMAASFRDFVLSAAGQAILARWGFGPPGAS
jgi:molybdate transport system substrate-binding protein